MSRNIPSVTRNVTQDQIARVQGQEASHLLGLNTYLQPLYESL